MSVDDLVARHRAAGDVQRSVLKEDTAAGTATVGRNDTAPDIHRSVVNVNTAAGRAVTAAAHHLRPAFRGPPRQYACRRCFGVHRSVVPMYP